MELEGIDGDKDEQIDRHRHLYEMKLLAKLEKKMRKVEAEKLKLLKQEQQATVYLK